MIGLNPGMFVMPVAALLAIVSLSVFFSKIAVNKHAFKHFIGTVITIAFILNYGWELSHCPLYSGCVYDGPHVAFLALASLADTIMALLLYFGLALIYQQGLWIQGVTAFRIFWVMLIGGMGATISELAHLSAGNWSYTKDMPLIPGTAVGLSPVLQFTILPILIYSLSRYRTTREATQSDSPT